MAGDCERTPLSKRPVGCGSGTPQASTCTDTLQEGLGSWVHLRLSAHSPWCLKDPKGAWPEGGAG